MSHPKPRRPRPLGSLRQISKNHADKLPSIPRLLPEISQDSIESLQSGIHGSAMAVPPPPQQPAPDAAPPPPKSRPSSDEQRKVEKKVPKSSGSVRSDVSHESCEKTIKDGLNREKELKDNVTNLHKQIAELKIALREKGEENTVLKDTLASQKIDYEKLLREEKEEHKNTQTTLEGTQEDLRQTKDRLSRLIDDHKEQMDSLRTESEKQLQEVTATKDAEIADRDQKLSRLKSQMADALKGNSWERQQQLEELTKELSRLQEESDNLRMKIKSISKSKQGSCNNCDENAAKVSKLQTQLKERDASIKELKALCSKFEGQLTQQDKLLEHWAKSQGHNISAPK